jgi:flagellin
MSLGVLNNIAAIYAENNLNQTTSSLQTTLQQLSSGSRINSGADDAAGLSLANGLAANSAALGQSSLNAQQGVGLLQIADGALSQVNSLLTRGVTLATEASNGTLNTSQLQAANQEYQSILAEINNIGATTTFNNNAVFTGAGKTIYTGDGSTTGASTDTLTIASLTSSLVGDSGGTISYATNGANVYQSVKEDAAATFTGTLKFQQGAGATTATVTLGATDTIATIANEINAANINGVSASVVSDGNVDGKYYLDVTQQGGNLVTFTGVGANDAATTVSANPLAVAFGFTLGGGTNGISYAVGTQTNLSTTNLTTAPTTALTTVDTAIAAVAAQRGYLGSQINTLNAAANVETTESTNITSAQNAITATDYGVASSNLSKLEILGQAGISALAQANSVQQEVLKLLQ